jgi:hypothetical protein
MGNHGSRPSLALMAGRMNNSMPVVPLSRSTRGGPQRPWQTEERGGEERQSTLGSLSLGRGRVDDASKDYGHVPWQLHYARKR